MLEAGRASLDQHGVNMGCPAVVQVSPVQVVRHSISVTTALHVTCRWLLLAAVAVGVGAGALGGPTTRSVPARLTLALVTGGLVGGYVGLEVVPAQPVLQVSGGTGDTWGRVLNKCDSHSLMRLFENRQEHCMLVLFHNSSLCGQR
jgi:hypothetical protein